jgi:Domain of unknown function (DUF1857)
MIYVSKELAVNANLTPGQPRLNRAQVWDGLVMKAENALPFVPGMAHCEVTERFEGGLVRDIVFRGERAREKITFKPQERVTFVRLSGNADGFIVNEILGTDDEPSLRFSFALQLLEAASDSPAEVEFRAVMERDYLKAVDATVAAIRRMVSETQ